MKYSFFYDGSFDGFDVYEKTDGAWRFWEELWHAKIKRYQEKLTSISKRINKDIFDIFYYFKFHDSELVKMELTREKGREKLVMAFEHGYLPYCLGKYEIVIDNVQKFEITTRGNFKWNLGLNDWIDGELLPASDTSLSLEMFFASGTTFVVIFPDDSLHIKNPAAFLPQSDAEN